MRTFTRKECEMNTGNSSELPALIMSCIYDRTSDTLQAKFWAENQEIILAWTKRYLRGEGSQSRIERPGRGYQAGQQLKIIAMYSPKYKKKAIVFPSDNEDYTGLLQTAQ